MRRSLVTVVLVLVACAPAEQAIETTRAEVTTTAAPLPPVASTTTTEPGKPAATTSATPATSTTTVPPLRGLVLELVADGLTEPVGLALRPGDGRIFVVERRGTIQVVDARGAVAEVPFADLRDAVHTGSIEQGLLGAAFHPADSSRLFVFHSRPDNDNQLVEYRVDDDGVDTESGSVLLVIDREADKIRHNGGHLEFGPDDRLFLSVGDGARASVNGQDPSSLPGTLLRLDVDEPGRYGSPADNPFVDSGGAGEVVAYGLRNPWRFSIDAATGNIWIGDVGQDDWEEIDLLRLDELGVNFGWPIMEGPDEFYGGATDVELVEPMLALSHDDTPACSLTMGRVYRGSSIPEYSGRLFFADWCFGWIMSANASARGVDDVRDHSSELELGMVSTFGVDQAGELLVVDYADGRVLRVVPLR